MTITARPVTHTAGGSLMPAGVGTAADGGVWIATRSVSAAAAGAAGSPRARSGAARRGRFRAHGGGQPPEEMVGHLARPPVDHPRADLRELAADLRLNLIM